MTTLTEDFQVINKLEIELLKLKEKYRKEKKELINKIRISKNSRDSKLKQLVIKECEESPDGHQFVDNSGTDNQSGRDLWKSEICTKCGFEKKD